MFAISIAVSNSILRYYKLIGNNHLWYIRSFLYISTCFFLPQLLVSNSGWVIHHDKVPRNLLITVMPFRPTLVSFPRRLKL